jgi:hypothetical protein
MLSGNIRHVSLGDYIVSVDTGKNYPQVEYAENTVGLIRTQNIRSVYADVETLSYIDKTIAGKTTVIGDLMFVRVGVGVGDCCVIDETSSGCAFSDNTLRVQIHSLNPEFVAIWVSLSIGKTLLIRSSKGSGKAVISSENIRSILVPVLPAKTQRYFCSAYRKAYTHRAAKLREADALLAGMDKYVCSALGMTMPVFTPRLGVAVTMAQVKADKAFNVEYYNAERTTIIDTIKTVPHKRLGDCAYFMRNLVSATDDWYLGLAGVQSNTGELSGAADEATGQAFSFRENDVLYCRLRPYLNKVWKAERGGVCSTEFHVIRMKSDNVLPDYLAAVMRSQLILRQTRHMMTGNTHPRIGNEDVANLLIPVPDKGIQRKVTAEMRARQIAVRAKRSESEAEWAAAKAQFERELLSTGGVNKK